jgi:hypothetical protein
MMPTVPRQELNAMILSPEPRATAGKFACGIPLNA